MGKDTLKKRIAIRDLIDPSNPDIIFESHKELCRHFGKCESWLTHRLRQGRTRYRGYEIIEME